MNKLGFKISPSHLRELYIKNKVSYTKISQSYVSSAKRVAELKEERVVFA